MSASTVIVAINARFLRLNRRTRLRRLRDCQMVGWSHWQRKEPSMMNHADGWMNGWMGGGMWIGTVIGVLVVVLLAVVITKLSKK